MRSRNNYVVRARKFMEEFLPYLAMTDENKSLWEVIDIFNVSHHRAVHGAQGTVRFALMTSDYVVKWDYRPENAERFGGCEQEWEFYQNIKDTKYNYLFAPIHKICVNCYVFYVMPRIKYTGYKTNKELCEFLNEEERQFIYTEKRLLDLHQENWGLFNKKPVIFDYAMVV